MSEADVLVVGAGPAGLTLAAQLAGLGCRPRVIDSRAEPWRPSRALMVHPRTLELLRPLGLTPRLLRQGQPLRAATVHTGRRTLRLRLPDLATDTAYPYLLMLPQARFEAVLLGHLAEHGIAVEWGTRLRGLTDLGSAVLADVAPGPPIPARFVVGCDGADSAVRAAAHIGFRGGSYGSSVTLADLRLGARPPTGGLHVFVGPRGMAFLGEVGEHAPWRMLTTEPEPFDAGGSPTPLARAGVDVAEAVWREMHPQRYGLASRYRSGRVFLAGDAAHLHSPAGGQGMNTGIGDAGNLGWKLAFALRGLAGDTLLDTYEAERRPLACLLVALTSVVYIGESSGNPLVAALRRYGPVLAAPVVTNVPLATRMLLRVVGQLSYGYRHGPAAREAASWLMRGPRAGQRLGDGAVVVDGASTTLHQLTASPGMHLLVAGWPDQPDLGDLGPVHVHHVSTLPGGARGPGFYLIRPDGHVGLRGWGRDLGPVRRFLHAWR